jgi:hypothetical protein
VNVYADHNFLIYCIKNPPWRDAVVQAHVSGKAALVLSPWHFYEYGNASGHADTEDLIQFAEMVQPKWTMERADLLIFEFWVTWEQVWNGSKETVNPIGTLAEIVGILTKVKSTRTIGLTIRDFIDAFSAVDALDEIRTAMKSQESVAAYNQAAYVQGRLTKTIRDQMEVIYLAVHSIYAVVELAAFSVSHGQAAQLHLSFERAHDSGSNTLGVSQQSGQRPSRRLL